MLERNTAARERLSRLWGYVGDENVTAYQYASIGKKNAQKRGELGPEDVLANREGLVLADASRLFELSFTRLEPDRM